MKFIRLIFIVLCSFTFCLFPTHSFGVACSEVAPGRWVCDSQNPGAINGLTLYPNISATPGPACVDSQNMVIEGFANQAAVPEFGVCSRGLTVTGATDVVRLRVQAASGQTAALQTWENASKTPQANVSTGGKLTTKGLLSSAPVTLAPGTTAAGTAPLYFQSGPLLSSVEAGAMEYYNNGFWLTNLAVRRTIVQGQEVLTSDVTVANTAVETTVYTINHEANYWIVGKLEETKLTGAVTSNSGAGTNTLTVRVKYAGSTLATFTLPEAARTAVAWHLQIMTTVRAIGAGTTVVQVHCCFDLNGTAVDNVVNTTVNSLDSTVAQATTVTFQWSDADPGNTINISQGRALSIDDN